MMAWLIAVIAGAAAAALQYGLTRAPSVATRVALGALRAAAVLLVVAILLDAPLGRARPVTAAVFVDASLSMTREGIDLARVARDTAAEIETDTVWFFGDSIRPAGDSAVARDLATSVRAVVDRSMAGGRPVVVVTDGETRDSSALDALVSGSRIVVLRRPDAADGAVASVDAPRAIVSGDSLTARVTLLAGSGGAGRGTLQLRLDDATLGSWPLEELAPWSERQQELTVRIASAPGIAILRAIVSSEGDREPRNDTLSAVLEVSRAASVVFVSSSPDQDSRFALAVLRGALALPTRAYLRVAPGTWRVEGALTPTTEADVRSALRDAPVAILHGDTSIFGAPLAATFGSIALLAVPDTTEGEWYPSAAPVSPLSGPLTALPLDSLPPISVGAPATGDWVGLEARRGRESITRAVVVGRDSPRRVVVVTGSGFWRWRFRAGISADAHTALWGGIFDWLAAERADRRAAVPEETSVRAGRAVRWRRGSGADTVVRLLARRRGASDVDSLVLRYGSTSNVAETPPLPPGVYDVTAPGGSSALAVNASAELLPTRPALSSSSVGRRANPHDAPGARSAGWLYALAIVLLCLEWILRRRAGLR